MAMLGEDGSGYELAQKLEASSAWRTWLGDGDYGLLKPHMASLPAWLAFMASKSSSQDSLRLQLRVRALLFDKASSALFVQSPDFRLHPDSIYFTLEQDADDWCRLQAGGSAALAALQAQHGLDPIHDSARYGGERQRWPTHNARSSRNYPSNIDAGTTEVSFSKAKEITWDPADGMSSGSRLADNDDGAELWYDKWQKSQLMERMSRLANRIAEQKLPFEDQEALVRTPKGMAKYVEYYTKVTNKRKADMQRTGGSGSTLFNPVQRIDAFGSAVKLEMDSDAEEAEVFFPEFMFPANCVPDNPVPANSVMDNVNYKTPCAWARLKQTSRLSHGEASFGLKSRLILGPGADASTANCECSPISGDAKGPVKKRGLSELEAQAMMKQTIVKIVASSGYEGLKEGSLDTLCELFCVFVKKLGSNLRMLVDRYGKECSQMELLRMYMQIAGGGSIQELLEYMKTSSGVGPQDHQSQQQHPQQQQQHQQQQQLQQHHQQQQQLLQRRKQVQQVLPSLQVHQGYPQQLQRQPSTSMLGQLNKQNLQQQLDTSKRRQVVTPRGKKLEVKLSGDTAPLDSPVNLDSKPYASLQTMTAATQQHHQQPLWQPMHQPNMFQHLQQQLSFQQHPSTN